MPSLPTPEKLARLRSFLTHLELSPDPCDDPDTTESMKNLVINQIRALEIAQSQASKPPELD